MLKTGLIRPLMRGTLEKLHECEGRVSEFYINSATDDVKKNWETKMDGRLSGTSRKMAVVTMVPPILMAELRSASYETKRSDRTLNGATLEMEILSQCGESIFRDFRPSCMNHGSVIGS